MLHRCQKVVLFVQHSQYSLVNTGFIYFLSAIPIDPLERHFTEPQTAGGRGVEGVLVDLYLCASSATPCGRRWSCTLIPNVTSWSATVYYLPPGRRLAKTTYLSLP